MFLTSIPDDAHTDICKNAVLVGSKYGTVFFLVYYREDESQIFYFHIL